MEFRGKKLLLPIIQGGMGVGISLGRLAGAVAKCGAMGVISTADIGFQDEGFWQHPDESNREALKAEIAKAKTLSQGQGIVAINAMVATKNYADLIRVAVESGVDCVISGAGLPVDLPALVKGSDTLIAPIVSSGKAAGTICKFWEKRHEAYPDFVVLEGKDAGGHLGFSKEDVLSGTAPELEDLLPDVLSAVKPYEEKAQRPIPVFVAGGIYDAGDIKHFLNKGAAGAQIATRFIATDECDASMTFKQMYLNAQKDDIVLTISPVGMPGRALKTPLVQRLQEGVREKVQRCINCLIPCDVKTTPYCITSALIKARNGNVEDGLFFSGTNAWRLNQIIPVKELIEELAQAFRPDFVQLSY